MNAIIGYTTLAKAENNPPTTREYLGKIEDSSQHLLALINDILEMSRIESGKVELEQAPEDLCAILDAMYDLFAEQMKQKKMAFSVHTSQVHHRYVWCDKKNLNRVLLNVLSNAFKFTPEGGTITASLYEINGVEIAKMILEQMGFVLETAENGQIAVDMISASSPGYYDAVLMDIQMPVMDGYAATRAIRSLNDAALANVPILAMTANAFQEDVRAAMDAGMQAHIAKPIDIGAMMSALTKVLKNDQEQIKR